MGKSFLARCVFLLSLLHTVSGCAVGLDSIIFVTKTEVAVDLDTEPPAADIGYARREFVLAPIFKDGEVHPVLTTVGARPGVLDFGANQSFATGDAAIVMADAFSGDLPYPFDAPNKLKYPSLKSEIVTSPSDKVPEGFWSKLAYFFTGSSERRRYFFGTDTNFGLHVQWSASEVPRAVSLGYKRKELSYIPLIEKVTKDGAGMVQDKRLTLASLIATANVKSQVGAPSKTGVEIGQTFATGVAATLLAADPYIRRVLGPSIIQKYDEIRALRLDGVANVAMLHAVYQQLAVLAHNGDAKAQKAVGDLDAVDTPLHTISFNTYRFNDPNLLLVQQVPRPAAPSFTNVTVYFSELKASVSALAHALDPSVVGLEVGDFNATTGAVTNKKPLTTEQDKKPFVDALELQKALAVQIENQLATHPSVLQSLEYFIAQLKR